MYEKAIPNFKLNRKKAGQDFMTFTMFTFIGYS